METVSLDTETTGLDPFHGSKPFLVTMCHEDCTTSHWTWRVNPITREPIIPKREKRELLKELRNKRIIFHNAQFDVRMLSTIGIDNSGGRGWDWSNTYDTSIMSHLVNSSRLKNLEFCTLFYLGIDVSKLNADSKKIVQSARLKAKKLFPDWRIAKEGLEDMPSAKQTVWKADLWLPRELMATDEDLGTMPLKRKWGTFLDDYANADSESTLLLWNCFKDIIRGRDHWNILEERMDQVRIIYEMENRGITVSNDRLKELEVQYDQDSKDLTSTCQYIADTYDLEEPLELPKSGNNLSLTNFLFNVIGLKPHSMTKGGKPSLDKKAIAYYEDALRPRSKEQKFISTLAEKRARDTALNYMESYHRFMIDIEDGYSRMYPSVNPCGTRTLRMSSRNPNEQNISKRKGFNLRYAFGPPPGREWWALDYNNLELRIPAYECEEPAMLELFERPDDPPFYGSYHMLIVSILYKDKEWKSCLKEGGEECAAELFQKRYKSTLYQWTKNGNFAELYGAVDTTDEAKGKIGTADAAYHYPGAQRVVAAKLRNKAELNSYYISMANELGYVETLPDKTVNPGSGYPIWCARNERGHISPTVPLNSHVQGTACWVMCRAMQKVDQYLSGIPTDAYMIMNVHDEIVFDFPYKKKKGNLPKVKKIAQLMSSCGDDVDVNLTVGIDYHPHNWSETS